MSKLPIREAEVIDVEAERRRFPIGGFVADLDFCPESKRELLELYGQQIEGLSYKEDSDLDKEWIAVLLRDDDKSGNAYYQVSGDVVLMSATDIVYTSETIVLNAWDASGVYPLPNGDTPSLEEFAWGQIGVQS